jgi:hypothetical protein
MKASGLGARLWVAGVDLSGDAGEVNRIASPRGVDDRTGIDKSAHERALLGKDGEIAWNTFFNPAAGAAHPVLSALPTADVPVTYGHRATAGTPAASMVAKQIGYDGTRAAGGRYTLAVQALANGFGLEWGRLLTAGGQAILTGAPQTSGWDSGIATATEFGLQAWLHVLEFDGTDVTLAIQDSDDDDPGGEGDAYANVTGAVFTQTTLAVTSQRLQTARDASVKRWLRVAATTSAGFTSVTAVVAVRKNLSEVTF